MIVCGWILSHTREGKVGQVFSCMVIVEVTAWPREVQFNHSTWECLFGSQRASHS